jgi:hypothetical protein
LPKDQQQAAGKRFGEARTLALADDSGMAPAPEGGRMGRADTASPDPSAGRDAPLTSPALAAGALGLLG